MLHLMLMLFRRDPDPELQDIAEACAVGTVTARSVRFWMRMPATPALTLKLSHGAGRRSVRFAPPARPESDHTGAITYPDDFPGELPLDPLTRYEFTIEDANGRVVSQGRFETFPATAADTPERFSFAFSSCHQPFTMRGRPAPESVAMLTAAKRALDAHDVKFLILGGDQLYADAPPRFSLHGRDNKTSVLLERSREDIRRVYHSQYRRFWSAPGFLELGLGRGTHCMLDDHEIVDNWGSAEAHASPQWQRVAAGAMDAYFDYQGVRNVVAAGARPRHLYHSFSYGTCAVFIADARSERSFGGAGGGRVMSEAQIADLGAFLRKSGDKHCVFINVGVPLIHTPRRLNDVGQRLLSGGSDLHDRWSNPAFVAERDRLLAMIAEHQRQHPKQTLALLSGDIHAGWAAALQPRNSPAFYQFVASALTNHSSSLTGTFARALLELSRPLEHEVSGLFVRRVPGQRGNRNPYGGLNLGIVEVERAGATSSVRFKLIGQDPKRLDHPLVVFDSGRLAKGSGATVNLATAASPESAADGG